MPSVRQRINGPGILARMSEYPEQPRARWPWISLTPIGLGAWAPIYGGWKARRPVWVALGVVWTLLLVLGFVLNGTRGMAGHDDLAGACLIAAWIGGAATSFALRRPYEQAMASPLLRAEETAAVRLADRERARRIAHRDPRLAAEMGIGRTDAVSAGLVDINSATLPQLLRLPGVDGTLAGRIITIRERVRGFSSLEDMGTVLDVDGALIEGLRDWVVFLPRAGAAGD
jgi:hypothetical protein